VWKSSLRSTPQTCAVASSYLTHSHKHIRTSTFAQAPWFTVRLLKFGSLLARNNPQTKKKISFIIFFFSNSCSVSSPLSSLSLSYGCTMTMGSHARVLGPEGAEVQGGPKAVVAACWISRCVSAGLHQVDLTARGPQAVRLRRAREWHARVTFGCRCRQSAWNVPRYLVLGQKPDGGPQPVALRQLGLDLQPAVPCTARGGARAYQTASRHSAPRRR